jgi:hypothetical protein
MVVQINGQGFEKNSLKTSFNIVAEGNTSLKP